MRKSAVVPTFLALLAGTLLLPPESYAADFDSRVARVSYVSGDVSYQRGDDEDWNGLRVNTPLVTGDSFFAPDGGRAEVDLGSGIVIRLDGGTQIQLVNNTRDVSQLGMTSGFLDIRARSFPPGFTLEIDTPSGAVTILEPGRYRVEVTDRAATYSVVRGGMSLALDGEQLDVREGESLELENTENPTYAYGRLGARTPFYSWSDERDSRLERSASARYVNADVVGYEDLDDHGSWRESREYGRVWTPSGMSAGWAPYQSGRWIWQDPYGWTWVSDESWGWAPYHYGRWVQTDNSWGWVPPPPRGYRGPSAVMNIEAVYAPALVGFVGGRNWGVSLSIGGPAIGWVPLAPRERYYYPWQSAPRVTNNYTNITVNNAVTIVNYNTFATASVRPIRVAQTHIERAPVIGFTAVGVVPTRGSLFVSSGRRPGSHAMPRVRAERPVVARLVPPPRPQQFAQKVAEIQRTGRPVARPVVMAEAVGKPFVPGARTPEGVRVFSARAPEGRKQLRARGGGEVRTPKRIERDIAPPTPAATAVAPPPVRPGVTPSPRERQVQPDPRPVGQPDVRTNDRRFRDRNAPAPTPPDTQAVAPPPVRPDATPSPRDRRVQPEPRPAEQPELRKDPARGNGPSNSPQARPNDRRFRDRNAPAPTPPDTQAVAPPPVRPDATPSPRERRVQPEPRPAEQPEVRRGPAPRSGPSNSPQAMPNDRRFRDRNAPAPQTAPTPPVTQAVAPPPVKPEPTPARGHRQVQPRPPQPTQQPEARRAPAPVDEQVKAPPPPPNRRKGKAKRPPDPPPVEPASPPPRDDGK